MSKRRPGYPWIYPHGNNHTHAGLQVSYGPCLMTAFKEEGIDSLSVTLFWVQENTELL